MLRVDKYKKTTLEEINKIWIFFSYTFSIALEEELWLGLFFTNHMLTNAKTWKVKQVEKKAKNNDRWSHLLQAITNQMINK